MKVDAAYNIVLDRASHESLPINWFDAEGNAISLDGVDLLFIVDGCFEIVPSRNSANPSSRVVEFTPEHAQMLGSDSLGYRLMMRAAGKPSSVATATIKAEGFYVDSRLFSDTPQPSSVAVSASHSIAIYDRQATIMNVTLDGVAPAGAPGPAGPAGEAATLSIGQITTLPAGSSATVVNVGTANDAVLNIGLPVGATGAQGPAGIGQKGDKGDTGSAATVQIGSVTTGAAGSAASVTNVGTSSAAVLNISIPRGDKGDTGPAGASGSGSGSASHAVVADTTGTQPLQSGGFRTVALQRVKYDTNGSWDAANYTWTVTVAGFYAVSGYIRLADNSTNDRQYSIGIATSTAEHTGLNWIRTVSNRQSANVNRYDFFNAGDKLRLVAFAEGFDPVINSASFAVVQQNVLPSVAVTPPAPLVLAFAGSSSPNQYLESFSGGTQNANVTASSDGVNFTTMTSGRFGMDLGNKLYTDLNRPVKFIKSGVGGTRLTTWEEASSTYRANLVNAIKAVGRCDLLLLQVGWNDVSGNVVGTLPEQIARIRSLISKIRTETNLPNLKVAIAPSQDNSGNPETLAIQRFAEMTVANTDANCFYAMSVWDVPTSDGIHQTEAGQATTSARFAPQAKAIITGTAQVRGPFLSGASAVSNTQTLVTITHRSGTDFTPATDIRGFVVKSSSGTNLAVSAAVRQSATTILLTHASSGGGNSTVYYMPNGDAADDNFIIRDNSTYALPMESSAGAIAFVGKLAISGVPQQATQNSAYNYTPTIVGGSGTKSFVLTGTLPAGLTFSTTTGAISGTPTTSGTTTGLNITVTDSTGSASLGAFNLIVAAAVAGETFAGTVTEVPLFNVNGVKPAYVSFDVMDGNTINRKIEIGIAGKDATNTPLLVLYDNKTDLKKDYDKLVNGARSNIIANNATSLTNASMPYRVVCAVTADGSIDCYLEGSQRTSLLAAPYNSTAFNNGTIMGTAIYVKVLSGPAINNVRYLPASTLTITGTPGQASQGSPYSFTPTTSGGSGTKTFALTGTLPAGLTFSTSTGSITGTPTATGTTTGLNITVSDGTNTASLGAFSLVVGSENLNKVSKVMLGFSDTVAPTGWSKIVCPVNFTAANSYANINGPISDTSGAATGWSLNISNANYLRASGQTTSNNSGVYPDTVLLNGLTNGPSVDSSNGGAAVPSTTVTLSGLNPSRTYKLDLFGSRAANQRNVIFTVNGSSQTLDTGYNTSNIVTFSNLTPDANGQIAFTWAGQSGGYGHWNAVVVTQS